MKLEKEVIQEIFKIRDETMMRKLFNHLQQRCLVILELCFKLQIIPLTK